jgi:hypothetical protein
LEAGGGTGRSAKGAAAGKAGAGAGGDPLGAGPRRLVFLDVDGVLHPLSERGLPAEADVDDLVRRADEEDALPAGAPLRVCAGEFLPRCLAVLRRVVDEAGADIVLSSTWRESPHGVLAVNAQLAQHRMRPVLGSTPILPQLHRCRRAQEIHAFLCSAEAARGCSFVVLDDDDVLGDEARLAAREAAERDRDAGDAEAAAAAREALAQLAEVDIIVGMVRPHFVRVEARRGLTEDDGVRALNVLLREQGGS